MFRKQFLVPLTLTLSLSMAQAAAPPHEQEDEGQGIRRVLLISVDGMHAVDYINCSKGIAGANNGEPFCPNLAALGASGVNYLGASASKPSDSFPGLTALVTGGSPKSTGVFYDVAYDRSLDPQTIKTGNGVLPGICTAGAPAIGARTEYEEGIDLDQSKLNGGAPGLGATDGGIAAIDPLKLPRDPRKNCAPVYPWNFLRTNTIFGVIHEAGGYTAWSDKHASYSSVSGPGNGKNIDDYYSPEINSTVVALPGVKTATGLSCSPIADASQTGSWTDSFDNIKCYDTLKVNAILNEISGKTHMGAAARVPNIFGMNFQAVSVGQKLIEKNVGTGGYTDNVGTPTPLMTAEIQFVDASIGEMVTRLKARGLLRSTLIIITAKHGQSPIDTHRFFPIPGSSGGNGIAPSTVVASYLPDSESPTGSGIGPTEDDVTLLWLTDSKQTANAVTLLEANAAQAGIGQIFSGSALTQMFNSPEVDPRSPDIIVSPNVGVVYTTSKKKQSEHGGFSHDDTNVILLVSNPGLEARTINAPVETMQVAPTILKVLGLDPNSLESVRQEGTATLPGLR